MGKAGAIQDDTTNLLALLRRATGPSHSALDQKFGQFQLTTRDGYVRFLGAHLAGLRPVFAIARDFVSTQLGMEMPDFPDLLYKDFEDLGEVPGEGHVPALAIVEPAAVTYVLAGSRLGVAALAREDYFGKKSGSGSRYMDEKSGLAIWRAHSAWLQDFRPGEAEGQRMAMSAIATFDCFAAAIAHVSTVRAG